MSATRARSSSRGAIEFNHGLAEIITAVMDAGLDLVAIEEHDSVPWAAIGGPDGAPAER